MLKEIKTELAGVLAAAGIETFSYIPEIINPPSAIIFSGSPYLERQTFQDYTVRLEVYLLVRQGSNDVETDDLDAMLEVAIEAVEESDSFSLEEVSQPSMLTINNTQLLQGGLTVTATVS